MRKISLRTPTGKALTGLGLWEAFVMAYERLEHIDTGLSLFQYLPHALDFLNNPLIVLIIIALGATLLFFQAESVRQAPGLVDHQQRPIQNSWVLLWRSVRMPIVLACWAAVIGLGVFAYKHLRVTAAPRLEANTARVVDALSKQPSGDKPKTHPDCPPGAPSAAIYLCGGGENVLRGRISGYQRGAELYYEHGDKVETSVQRAPVKSHTRISQSGQNNIAQIGNNNQATINPQPPEMTWVITDDICAKLLAPIKRNGDQLNVSVGAFISDPGGANVVSELLKCLPNVKEWKVNGAVLPPVPHGVVVVTSAANETSAKSLRDGLCAVGFNATTQVLKDLPDLEVTIGKGALTQPPSASCIP